MQKKNCVLCISIGIIVCILLSACSKQPDFDAKSYVQSSLDAYYHGEYKDYANLLEISEKDARKKSKRILMRASNSNLMILITLRTKELLIMRKNWQK